MHLDSPHMETPHQQILFCDIQIKVVISRRTLYVYLKICYHSKSEWPWIDLSRSLKVKFDSAIELPIYGSLESPYMVSYSS